jgi:hypothetical protein
MAVFGKHNRYYWSERRAFKAEQRKDGKRRRLQWLRTSGWGGLKGRLDHAVGPKKHAA